MAKSLSIYFINDRNCSLVKCTQAKEKKEKIIMIAMKEIFKMRLRGERER